jgi:hypothetical protein
MVRTFHWPSPSTGLIMRASWIDLTQKHPILAAIFSRLSSRGLARVSGRSEARRRPSDRRSPGPRTHPRRLAAHRIPDRSRGSIADLARCRYPSACTATRLFVDLVRVAGRFRSQSGASRSSEPIALRAWPWVQAQDRRRCRGAPQRPSSSGEADRGVSDDSRDHLSLITPLARKPISLSWIFFAFSVLCLASAYFGFGRRLALSRGRSP